MTDKKPVHNEEFSWTVHDFSRPKKAVDEMKMEWPKEPERPRRSVNLDDPISFDIDVFKKRSESEQLPKEDSMFRTAEPEPIEVPAAKEEPAPVEPAAPKEEMKEEPKEEPKAAEAVSEEPSPEQKLQELAELTEKLRKQQNAERQAAAQNAMNSSRQAAAAEAREESLRKADPFFDFSNTNIAFQDLLDQEYAKLQRRKEGVPYVESHWRYEPEEEPVIPMTVKPEPIVEPTPEEPAAETSVEEEPIAEAAAEEPTSEEPVANAPKMPELPESPEDALERMLMEGTSSFNPDRDATIQVDLSAIKKAAAQRYGYETEADLDGIPVELTGEEPIPVVKAVEDIVPETAPETPEEIKKKRNTMTEMERAREEYFKMLDQELGGVQVKVEVNTPYGQAGKVITDVDIKPNHTVERRTTILKASEIRDAEIAADAAVVTGATAAADVKSDEPKVEEEKHEEMPKAEEPIKESAPEPKKEEIVWPLDPSQYDEDERGGFFSVLGKILLAIIALVIALEIGALAILYFAPDSSIGGTVKNVQDQVMEFVGSVRERFEKDDVEADDPTVDPNAGQDEPSGETGGESQPTADSKPMADKAKLVQTQMDHNKNIKSVEANSALAYKSGVDYGISDLNKSQPIANNIWYTNDDGTPVYYDQEVVGALIAFNSQWIDYVNDGDKAVLKLTKEGSDAYNNAVNFSKAGKVKEEFVSVEIGEIRQGEQGFYLWVGEKIELTENGTTSTAEYQWVYCMEPVGKEMKITDYINVKNK